MQCSLISCMQKVVIYETKSRYYVVGSNNTETRFRVLKLDRSEQRQLSVVDDKVEYSALEIQDLLHMIDVGNRCKSQQRGSHGLSRTISAFGIVGFVRFLEGFYVILITKRRRVALLGPHTIYKIEDTRMVYIPNDSVRCLHPEEQRYVKMFQNMDLSSNFYFSYSYDLTHTLQYNMTPCRNLQPPSQDDNLQPASTESLQPPTDCVHGIRTGPCSKFAWNWYLLKDVGKDIHSDWLLYVLHGFIGQSNIDVFGRPIYLTLIARRSRKFAGTRFLKRGSNSEGDVANEVETEQIVYDASVLSLHWASVTAFVQLRASIPAHWSQDVSKMVPKPTIIVDQMDPYAYVAGLHFDQVLQRYGAPIIILDLVKRKEKKRREGIASEQMVAAVEYLNQFLSPQHNIKYISFDMARVTKNKKANVFSKLAEIAEYCVKKLGYFKTVPRCHGNQQSHLHGVPGEKQRGVVRTNCIDCLDRTNTAQFAIGKCVLAHQLYGLGVLDKPTLQFDTDCVRMLEDLYEDHGDTLALQYGGSQLVHRIKGYRKVAPWTSSSRDIMQTLSRCYSNAFSDADRQQTMNLFLGVFVPEEGHANIWELSTDFYLHNPVTLHGRVRRQRTYSQWWDPKMISCLPNALEQEYKGTEAGLVIVRTDQRDERVDGYYEYYQPHKLTVLEHLYSFHMHNSIRDFMPKCVNSYSPFALRVRPGRRQEQAGTTEANPNVSGKESTSSCTSTGSDISSSSGSDFDADLDDTDVTDCDKSNMTQQGIITLKDRFPTMAQTYGIDIQPANKQTVSLYKWFVQIGENAAHIDTCNKIRKTTHLIQRSVFPLDCSRHVEPPVVSSSSRNIYETYVKRGQQGAQQASKRDMKSYHDYVLSLH